MFGTTTTTMTMVKTKANVRFRLVLFVVGRPEEEKKDSHLPGRSKSSILFGGLCAISGW